MYKQKIFLVMYSKDLRRKNRDGRHLGGEVTRVVLIKLRVGMSVKSLVNINIYIG